MKKQLLSIVCIASTMLMASCSGNKNQNGEATPSVATEAAPAAEEFTGDTYSKEAVEHYVQNFKLAFSDLEPTYAYDGSDAKNYMGSARDVLVGFPTQDGAAMTDEMFRATVAKVYNATQKAADDGLCIYGYEQKSNKAEAMAEISLEECQKGTTTFGIHINQASWVYKQNNRLNVVSIGTLSGIEGCYVRVSVALQKSIDDTLEDAEQVIQDIENDPDKKATVEQALKDAGLN